MLSLKDKHKNGTALIIFGGPSMLENKYDLSLIDKNKYTLFLEAKTLTPRFIKFGLEPDYYLMFYPEKCKANSFQDVVLQSFLIDLDLSGLLKDGFRAEYEGIKRDFDKYFELWKPEKTIRKKYRYKKEICFPNSPFSLIHNFKNMKLISYKKAYEENMPLMNFSNPVHTYDHLPLEQGFSLENYFNPLETPSQLMLREYSFKDSGAIALFPILNYLGFNKVVFLGMDMSMFGSMEYASFYTFKSLKEYGLFFKKAIPIFNASFKPNFWHRYMRPVSSFSALQEILKYSKISFTNVQDRFKYALPIKGMKNITYKEFING